MVRAEASANKRLDELEIANADRIELQMLGALVVAQAINVRKITRLRGADVVQRCAGGDGGGGMAGEAEAVEGARMQLPLKERQGVVGAEGPGVETRLGADGIERRGKRFGGKRREQAAVCGK